MSNALDNTDYARLESEFTDITQQLSRLDADAVLDASQALIGAGGILDPSPTADLVNASISYARGDYFGAFFDGVSAVPYAGDLVGKPVRGLQMGLRQWRRGHRIASLVTRSSALTRRMIDARRAAATHVKELRRQAQEAGGDLKRRLCARCNTKYGSRVPKKGRWEDPDNPGHGKYEVDNPDGTTSTYHFKEGYPDMEHPDMAQYLHSGHPNVVDIKMTGDRTLDEALANGASGRASTPDGYSWHHGDDGTSMYLMNTTDHQNLIPHDGGNLFHDMPKDVAQEF